MEDINSYDQDMSSSDNQPTITATPDYQKNATLWYDSVQGEFFKEDKQNGTSAADSMSLADILFKVPENYTATLNATLGVDDWGALTVRDHQGNERLSLQLTPKEGEAGPRGGHAYWTKNGSINLEEGDYTIHIEHTNTTYPPEYDS